MANPARGEVALRVGDEDFILKFSTNAICQVEERLDKGLNTIIANMERVTTVRALLWAGLLAHRPDTSIGQAGEIIDRAGMAPVTEALGKALALAFPKAEQDPNV